MWKLKSCLPFVLAALLFMPVHAALAYDDPGLRRMQELAVAGVRLHDPGLPVAGWFPAAAPQDVGLDAPTARSLVMQAEAMHSDALVVLKDGKCVIERYWGKDEPYALFSVTKSFTSLAIGILLDEHRIASLDTPLSTWYPEWGVGEKSHVTLRHLLTHTSALSHESLAWKLGSQPDRLAYVRALPLRGTPGRQFSYNNEAVELLSGVVEQTAGEPLDRFLGDRLFQPLGITSWSWVKDPVGRPVAYGGLCMRPRDLAKLGQLLLANGRWQGRQILPSAWIAAMQTSEPTHPDYGLLWWLQPGQAGNTAPLGYYASGDLGQYLVICPSKNLVGVRTKAFQSSGSRKAILAENRRYHFREFPSLLTRL